MNDQDKRVTTDPAPTDVEEVKPEPGNSFVGTTQEELNGSDAVPAQDDPGGNRSDLSKMPSDERSSEA